MARNQYANNKTTHPDTSRVTTLYVKQEKKRVENIKSIGAKKLKVTKGIRKPEKSLIEQ